MIAKIFKMLISIDQKPDITLNLLRDDHYLDLFTCLNYLEENQDIKFDLENFFFQQSRFNNYLDLTNQEVINNINNNFRINFLKEFVFPTFLTDKQLDELTTFLTLHNNTIICHIDSVMVEKMSNLHQKIEENPQQSLDFFTELFCVFRSSFNDLKNNFAKNFINGKLHEKVLETLMKHIPLKREHQKDIRFSTVIQVCNEIIGFLCRNYQKAIIKVFKFKHHGVHLYEFLPEWTIVSKDDFCHQILDLFRIQPVAKNELIDEDCLDFFIDDLVVFLSESVKKIFQENQFNDKIKFVDFVIELFIVFFSFQSKRLNDVLVSHNFLDEVCSLYCHIKRKRKQIRFLKYMNEVLANSHEERLQRFDFRKVLTNFCSCFSSIPKGKDNMLRSLSLVIVKQIQSHQNTKVLDTLIEIIKLNKNLFGRDDMFEDIIALSHQTPAETIKVSSFREDIDMKPEEYFSKRFFEPVFFSENAMNFEDDKNPVSLQKPSPGIIFEVPNEIPEKSNKPILSVAVSEEYDENRNVETKGQYFKHAQLFEEQSLKKRESID